MSKKCSELKSLPACQIPLLPEQPLPLSAMNTLQTTEPQYGFEARLDMSNNKLWGAHFLVPDTIANTLIEGADRRMVCVLNGVLEYQCALIPNGTGRFVVTVNKKNREKLRLADGSLLQVQMWKDRSEFGLPMPEELAEVMAQDEEGARYLLALTPGKLRTFLYWIGQPKSSDIRIERALRVVEHLKKHEGKIVYKELMGKG
jgi:hypothetical protein